MRDHLGSVRAIAGIGNYITGIRELNSYLPFGTRIPGSIQASDNRHRFGGKEEQRYGIDAATGSPAIDLGLLDFGARYYDPYTCRWTTIDPMAGKYHSLSPYNYCGNNPTCFFDPDGNDREVIYRKNKIIIKASFHVDKREYNRINTFNEFSNAASLLNKASDLHYTKDGRTYKVKFQIDIRSSFAPEKDSRGKTGNNYVTIENTNQYRKDPKGYDILGEANGGKKVLIHKFALGNQNVLVHEMLHCLGAALRKEPDKDPHHDTGYMTSSTNKQTRIITQQTVNEIIEEGYENTR